MVGVSLELRNIAGFFLEFQTGKVEEGNYQYPQQTSSCRRKFYEKVIRN